MAHWIAPFFLFFTRTLGSERRKAHGCPGAITGADTEEVETSAVFIKMI
jgi:hypothetical protein